MKILSLGAGVQSTAILLMSCKDVLPKLDAAVFADTGWEPKEVYIHLKWLIKEAKKHGIPVHIVSIGNIRENHLKAEMRVSNVKEGRYQVDIPFFTKQPNGDKAINKRQCTTEYKIRPVQRKIRELLGYKKYQRIPASSVEQWIGISRDERHRAKMSRDKWIDNNFPLLTDQPMHRHQAIKWLQENYPKRSVPRSACIGCPFHSNAEWRNIKDNHPEEWADAVEFDKLTRRKGGMRGDLFLHKDCVPLDEADLDTPEEKGQNDWVNECTGMCGM